MMPNELGSIEVPASMESWDEIVDFPNELISAFVKDKGKAYKLRLAYEELVSNIIRSATENKSAGSGIVKLKCSAKNIVDQGSVLFILETSDTGIHFDPDFDNRMPVDTQQDVKDRPIGGLGLFLIIDSVDQVSYRWEDGKNIYELRTILGSSE